MSDGPHRSLPMKRRWRYVAERADKRAYTAAEISEAIGPALEQDCRDEMSPEFLSGIRRVMEPSLFRDDLPARLEALRPQAGSGLGRVVLDNVALLSPAEADGFILLKEAVKAALDDRVGRGARQVEEHYLREASAPRANNVRARLKEARSCTDFGAIAERVLSAGPWPAAPPKQKGLDDGVTLR
jgi:hypothetical protein